MNMKKTLYVTARAVKIPGEECDLSFVPPMTKRRFSPLQKVVFALLNLQTVEISHMRYLLN